jgi:hypothetical protein
VVRAHYGRYHDPLLTSYYDFLDPSIDSPFVTARVVGPDQFVEISRRVPSTSFMLDSRVTQSYVDEYLVGLDRELVPSLQLRGQYVRRHFKNFMGFIDTGSVYEPVQRLDPGPDGRSGTVDDGQMMTVYNSVNPNAVLKLFTNIEQAYRHYDAVQIIATRRYARNWELQASYTWSRAEGNVSGSPGNRRGSQDTGIAGVFIDPNRQINAAGRTPYDAPHEVKVLATYHPQWWGGFTLASIYLDRSGPAWGRTAVFGGLTQGFANVRIEPRGTRRLPSSRELNLRVEKSFALGGGFGRLGLFLDVLNATNQGVAESVIENAGPNFGLPNSWNDPRSVRANVRFTF